MWTPPHFWALSLYTSDDYAAAGVPMLPVAKGAAATRRADPALQPAARRRWRWRRRSPASAARSISAVAALGGAAFLVLAWRLARSRAGDDADGADGLYDVKRAKEARDLFGFSILYLFALFAALLVERLAGLAPLSSR